MQVEEVQMHVSTHSKAAVRVQSVAIGKITLKFNQIRANPEIELITERKSEKSNSETRHLLN